jgi:uncharacterized protein
MAHFKTAETHVSWLVFSGDRVFKIKKPVVLGFLDWREVAAREAACGNEVALNRRLSPSVYLGVGHFIGPDGGAEPVVVMRRLPAERALSARIGEGDPDLPSHVTTLADVLAAFHRDAGRSRSISRAATRPALRRLWADNVRQLAAATPNGRMSGEIEEAGRLATRYLASRRPLFNDRIRRGRIVDGHGDLLCDDIFITEDGPQILDCLEFDPRLRYGDVVSDLGSLAMDLEHHGRPDLAGLLLDRYQERSGDHWPPSLTHLWTAHRALVRAKVTYLRSLDVESTESEDMLTDADGLVSLALAHLRRAQPRVVLVGGLPGTGKSTLAAGLHQVTGWRVVSSDHVRRTQPSSVVAHQDGGTLYSAERVDDNYRTVVAEGRAQIRMGRTVILDATWSRDAWRAAAAAMARSVGADLIPLCCVSDDGVAADRLRGRLSAVREGRATTESEATPEVAAELRSRWEPWPEATTIDTSATAGEALEAALEALGWGGTD